MRAGGDDREILIVEEALGLAPGDRASFVARAAGDDLALRRRVEDLLARIDRGDASRELFAALLPALRSRTQVDGGVVIDPATTELRSLGKYRIESELGRGGQGVVYLAVDETLARRVALKVLHPSAALETATRQRFLREAGIASRLEHPAICVVYETGREQGVDYIAMRYVEGSTLARRIVEQATHDLKGLVPGHEDEDPMRAVAHLVEKVARALHLAHEAGVVHRDVKSGNIIVTPDGEPVVLDFGLAREQVPGTTITLSAELLGTPAYMSPEQVSGPVRALERRTDVWSLGVVLYHCLTLDLPFDGPTIHDIMRRIREDEPMAVRRRNPAVPRDLEVITGTALEKDLGRRYRTALDLAEDLRRFRLDETILARRAGIVHRATRYARRHPMRAIAFALCGIVVALVAGNTLLMRSLADRTRDQMRHDDLQDARSMEAEENTSLWPVRDGGVAAFDGWLAKLERLTSHRAEHATALDEMRARRSPDGSWSDYADFTFGTLLEEHFRILDRLDRLAPDVRARRERSATLRSRTVESHESEWSECIAAIARSPLYGGLTIEPQCGLVPMGSNEQGYFEFWHVESGDRPLRDSGGSVEIAEDSGMVLVLLPGGRTLIGACPFLGPRVDPDAQVTENPTWVTLDPFLLAKHEMTKGQWIRLFGTDPSTWKVGRRERAVLVDRSHPVETVTWNMSVEAMRRLDLTLPTDAQWEYACRAGSDSVWSLGNDHALTGDFANFHGEEANGYFGDAKNSGYRDPFPRHAPVGSFPANAFGMCDMHGNVWEWCLDRYEPRRELLAPRASDGAMEPPVETTQRVLRGGACDQTPKYGRSAGRFGLPASDKGYHLGLRAARRLHGVVR